MIKEIEKIKQFIFDRVNDARASGVIVGMSGGKDSFVVAKLCAEAIGKDKVLGVIMPSGKMKDLNIAEQMCNEVGIRFYVLDILGIADSVEKASSEILKIENKQVSNASKINLLPRIRMSQLYYLAASLNCLVANTSNLSEASVGYTTKWGDNVGDFAPIADFTKTEVCEIGTMLGLSWQLVNKIPDDGLSGKTDEENLGVSYEEIDKMIRTGKSAESEKILKLNKISSHKRQGTIAYLNGKKNFLK